MYFSPLLHPTHLHTHPRWAAQGTRPGYAGGWSVWYQISHAIQVRRFIHLGNAHSKQWAAICGIQVTIYGYPVTAGEDRFQPRDRLS